MSFIIHSYIRNCDDYLIFASFWVLCVCLVSDKHCFLFYSSWLVLSWLFPSEAPFVLSTMELWNSLFNYFLIIETPHFLSFFFFWIFSIRCWSSRFDFLTFHVFNFFILIYFKNIFALWLEIFLRFFLAFLRNNILS